jgi:beta-mannosidase
MGPMTISLDGSDWRMLPMMPREWEWRRVWEKPDTVTPALWIPAQVPGTVQDDARDAGLTPDYTVDFHSRDCEWTSERDWVYLKEFATPDVPNGGVVRLIFEGVDYACHVYLNGKHLGDHEGMYDAFEFDVTDLLTDSAPNTLVVVCEHAPREVGQIGRTSEVRLWKARFAYDWDWCTRLVPIGIYDSVRLEVTGAAYIRDVQVHTKLNEDLSEAEVGVSVDIGASRATPLTVYTSVLVHDPVPYRGEKVAAQVGEVLASGATTTYSVRCPVRDPKLWWPNGHGEQPLYEAEVSIAEPPDRILDTKTVTFGLRRVRALPNDGAPEGAKPYVLEANGRRVFIKGWNWAPIQQLYGRPGGEMYERWLRLAKEANCNLLRVWGGGLLEKECFYDLCDRLGIMVWQEFIHSSSGIDNRPSAAPGYLRYIRRQAMKMVPRRRNHPSLVIWTGGNELMHDNWTPLDDTHPALAVLRDVVRRLDPDRIWYPTSASGPVANASLEHVGKMHDVHGPWQYQGPAEHYRLYNGIDPLLHSEFGVEGAANLEAMPKIAQEQPLWPPDETNPLWLHHGAWWVQRAMMTRVFGEIDDLETYVRMSQFLQAEGLRYCLEANRRRKWRCGGTMPWQFNESWPNLSCTNVLDYFGQPRPAYWWCRNAYEPFHVSAKYDKLGWHPGEEFAAEVWLSNSLDAEPNTRVRWTLTDLLGNQLASGEQATHAPATGAVQAAVARWTVAQIAHAIFVLRVEAHAPSGRSSVNHYVFSTAEEPLFAPLLNAPTAKLEAARTEGGIELRNAGPAWALCVSLKPAQGAWMWFDRNCLCLAPGEAMAVRCAPEEAGVEVGALNVHEQEV